MERWLRHLWSTQGEARAPTKNVLRKMQLLRGDSKDVVATRARAGTRPIRRNDHVSVETVIEA